MKTHLLLLSVAAILYCASATAKGGSLKVLLKGSESITFALEESPKYWTSQEKLYVQSSSLYQEMELKDVEKIVFEEGASVPLQTAEGEAVYPSIVSDIVYVSSPNDARVEVVSVNGAVVMDATKKGEDRVEINASAWQTGEYIVRVNDKTFKIIKR